jgi:hypothetical protein
MFFDQIIEAIKRVSDINFEFSYSALFLGSTFYFAILQQWWLKNNVMTDIFKSKEEENVYVPIFMNLLPLLMATLEYYFDTISTDIALI